MAASATSQRDAALSELLRYAQANAFAIAISFFVILCHRKIWLWVRAILFGFLSNEKKGMKSCRDADVVIPDKKKGLSELESKIIIFIRHGESDWNYIFNKNKLLLLPRLVIGLIREALMFPSRNSLFIDSPLSSEGVAQSKQLQGFLEKYERGAGTPDDIHEAMMALRGDEGAPPSVLVSSNLRRAVNTGCIALWPRLQRAKERIRILSSLQEMSRNVDTTSLAGKGRLTETSLIENTLGSEFKASEFLDASETAGNKGFKRKAVKSMEEFCDWCFKQPEPVIIVSAGHSLYFKNFFRTFLPKKIDHHAKDKKMVNCGVVAFNLQKGVLEYDPHWTGFKIDGNSVTTLYGGFEKFSEKETAASRALKMPARQASGTKSKAPMNGKHTNGKHNDSSEGGVFSCCAGDRSK